jgi:hypothetical protein
MYQSHLVLDQEHGHRKLVSNAADQIDKSAISLGYHPGGRFIQQEKLGPSARARAISRRLWLP